MNTGRLAQIVKRRLLPHWVTFNLVNCWWNLSISKQVLQLLSWKVAHPDCACLTRGKQTFHCIPCLWKTQGSHILRVPTSWTQLCPKRPMHLWQNNLSSNFIQSSPVAVSLHRVLKSRIIQDINQCSQALGPQES